MQPRANRARFAAFRQAPCALPPEWIADYPPVRARRQRAASGTAVERARCPSMKQHSPDPNPIPPEMPSDPSRIPPPDMPVNVPPEKGPGQPEPLPQGPTRPIPVARASLVAVVAFALLMPGAASAQRPAGKDTSELEHPHPQQVQCSQISNAEERQRCLRETEGSGGPGTGKPPGAREAPWTNPSVGRETQPAPSGESKNPTDPDRPGSSR
jgi:hypothetical protein